MNMTDPQLLRYARHIQLPELDIMGQDKINHAHVTIIGLGGLGSPAALYLAASGVGHIHLVDDDKVELSNLQRQIIHTTETLQQTKVASARAALHKINPEISTYAYAQRANDSLLQTLIPQSKVVLDCSDNFQTRHLVNRFCVQYQIPLVSGSAIRFDGQISVFDSRHPDSPCYACLFDEQANMQNEPCATLGVFAPLVGIIGTMQAAEALKLIVGMGLTLEKRLLLLDTLTMNWQSLNIARNPTCRVCGDTSNHFK